MGYQWENFRTSQISVSQKLNILTFARLPPCPLATPLSYLDQINFWKCCMRKQGAALLTAPSQPRTCSVASPTGSPSLTVSSLVKKIWTNWIKGDNVVRVLKSPDLPAPLYHNRTSRSFFRFRFLIRIQIRPYLICPLLPLLPPISGYTLETIRSRWESYWKR